MTETARLVIAVDAKGVKTATDDIKKLGAVAGPAEKKASALGKAVGSVVAAVAVGGLASFIKESIDLADNASKAAQMAGVTTEALTGLQYAAGLADVSAGELNSSLRFLNLAISKAAGGGKEAQQAFGDIGVSIRAASGEIRSADAVLLDVADRFSQYENGAEKAALAQELFGRSGTVLIPLLNSGAAGIRELTAQAERFGLVVSQETASASEEFNDSLTVMQGITRGVGNQLARELLPTLNDITGTMISVTESTGAASTAADVLSGTLKGLVTAGIVVGASFKATGEAIGAFAAGVAAAASGEFASAVEIFKQGGTDYKDTTVDALKRINELWNGSAGTTGAAAAKVAGSLRELKRGATEAGEESSKAKTKVATLTDAIGAQVSSLQFQASVVGKDKDEIVLLKLALDGATESQLAAANAALGTVTAYDEQLKATEKLAKAEEDKAQRGKTITQESLSDLEVLGQKQQSYYDALQEGSISQETFSKVSAKNSEAMREVAFGAGEATTALDDFTKTAQDNIQSQLADNLTNGFQGSFKDILSGWGSMIQRMVAEAAAAQITKSLFGAVGLGGGAASGAGGNGAALAGIFSSFAGFFDNGGNIPSGKFGVVGERGPEIVSGPVNVTGRKDTAKMTGGNTIIINQPGVSSTREADRSAGATRRAVMGAVNSGSRYA
jgi:hypothetical protein